MSKILLLSIFCYLFSHVYAQDGGAISNPLDVQFGDPYILRTTGGKYYMYGTGAGAENGFVAYSSDDLKNWKRKARFIMEIIRTAGVKIHTGRLKYMNGMGSIICSIVRSGK